jgi:hypothetical protein
MTDVRKDGIVPDPSQLAEMQATDARLDRIGRRRPEPDDLDDPVFAALAGLATEVDVVDPSQDAAVARLIEVLDGRPLWVLDGEDLADADAEAAQDMIVLDDPAWEARGRQIIDLRRDADADADTDESAADEAGRVSASTADADDTAEADDTADSDETADLDETADADETADDTAGSDTDEPARVAAEAADEVPPTVAMPVVAAEPETAEPETADETTEPGTTDEDAELPVAARVAEPAGNEPAQDVPAQRGPVPGARVVLPLRPSRRRTGDEPSWERIVRRASLPAAAAITLFAVGGGITAALTGDPMSPLTGVTRAIDSFGEERTSYASLQQDLELAQGALASGDVEKAKALVESARSGLDEVPAAEADLLKQQIEDVQQQIAAAPTTPAPVPSAPATKPPASNPEPSSPQPSTTTEPSPSASDPTPTQEPSVEPSETPEPSETQVTEAPSVAASPAAEGSSTGSGG